VEMWLDDPLSCEKGEHDEIWASELGYTRLDKKWQLAIRYKVEGVVQHLQRLAEVKREDKILATGRLHELVTGLLQSANTKLSQIAEATIRAREVLTFLNSHSSSLDQEISAEDDIPF